jgi:hypothetical protein
MFRSPALITSSFLPLPDAVLHFVLRLLLQPEALWTAERKLFLDDIEFDLPGRQTLNP